MSKYNVCIICKTVLLAVLIIGMGVLAALGVPYWWSLGVGAIILVFFSKQCYELS